MGTLRIRRLVTLAAVAPLLACTPVPTGELGQGNFRYLCAPNQADAACWGSTTSDCNGSMDEGGTCNLPTAYAVGARFQIAYAPTTDFGYATLQGLSNYLIVPASPELAVATGNSIVPQRRGFVALFAMETGLSSVDDFIHVQLSDVATIAPAAAAVSLSAGQSQTLSVVPSDANGSQLAGEVKCTWTIAQDGCVVRLAGRRRSSAA
jgi:hypothetical protein